MAGPTLPGEQPQPRTECVLPPPPPSVAHSAPAPRLAATSPGGSRARPTDHRGGQAARSGPPGPLPQARAGETSARGVAVSPPSSAVALTSETSIALRGWKAWATTREPLRSAWEANGRKPLSGRQASAAVVSDNKSSPPHGHAPESGSRRVSTLRATSAGAAPCAPGEWRQPPRRLATRRRHHRHDTLRPAAAAAVSRPARRPRLLGLVHVLDRRLRTPPGPLQGASAAAARPRRRAGGRRAQRRRARLLHGRRRIRSHLGRCRGAPAPRGRVHGRGGVGGAAARGEGRRRRRSSRRSRSRPELCRCP